MADDGDKKKSKFIMGFLFSLEGIITIILGVGILLYGLFGNG
ncbi:hypothetical protein [Cellvibrio japonicus]|nr:hypothetical protein [Cellvibrio japonicus]